MVLRNGKIWFNSVCKPIAAVIILLINLLLLIAQTVYLAFFCGFISHVIGKYTIKMSKSKNIEVFMNFGFT